MRSDCELVSSLVDGSQSALASGYKNVLINQITEIKARRITTAHTVDRAPLKPQRDRIMAYTLNFINAVGSKTSDQNKKSF